MSFVCPADMNYFENSHHRITFVWVSGSSYFLRLLIDFWPSSGRSSRETQNSFFVWPSGVSFGTVWSRHYGNPWQNRGITYWLISSITFIIRSKNLRQYLKRIIQLDRTITIPIKIKYALCDRHIIQREISEFFYFNLWALKYEKHYTFVDTALYYNIVCCNKHIFIKPKITFIMLLSLYILYQPSHVECPVLHR